ncbi:MAG: hydratase, partial [Oscillospiraceae bacterium]|nr:hydratase [Oscillospiraceae bacterium]
YVKRAKATRDMEAARAHGDVGYVHRMLGIRPEDAPISSAIYCTCPGDGSAREQAASCQRVLGAGANIAREYATKRYRSNVINWGMVPFETDSEFDFAPGDWVYVPGIRQLIASGGDRVTAAVVTEKGTEQVELRLPNLSAGERAILLAGCLMNKYREDRK